MIHPMNEHAAGAAGLGVSRLPYDPMAFYEQRRSHTFKIPRVVPHQKDRFESDELFRRLSRESEVRYTGYRDRPMEERQVRFQNSCREGQVEIAFAATGTNLQLVFGNACGTYPPNLREDCDFDKEHGKVHLRSHLIMNGVCVRWRGWIDLDRLDGVGCLEYDEELAAEEDAHLRKQLELYSRCGLNYQHLHHPQEHHMAGTGGTGAISAGIEPHMTHRQDPEMEVRLRAY